MPHPIGHVASIHRYPVKSMRAVPLTAAQLGWHGLAGDRRFAFRRTGDRSGFPWLTASKVAELVLFTPFRDASEGPGDLPTHVRTPEGAELPLFSEALASEVARRFGAPVEMLHVKTGIFDDACVSVISAQSRQQIGALAGLDADVRRFRPNIELGLLEPAPFQEDGWLGGALSFGDGEGAATISLQTRDTRCVMINIDPESGERTPEVLKAVARRNGSTAGVYGTVTRTGEVAVGQPVFFTRRP